MDAGPDASANLFDEAGVIVADMSCRRCGYNLRGLHRDHRCPECGTPVGLSVHGELIRFAEPGWAEKVALGFQYMIWGLLISVGVTLAGCCFRRIAGGDSVIVHLVTLAAAAVSLYGVWLMTAPDPSRFGRDTDLTARKITRYALLAGLFALVLRLLTSGLPGVSAAFLGIVLFVAVILSVADVVGQVAKYLYLSRLAERIPHAGLAGRARFLCWAIGITDALGTVALLALAIIVVTSPGTSLTARLGLPGAAAPPTTSAPAASLPALPPVSNLVIAGGILIGLISIARIVFGVVAFQLLIALGRQFREQARIARDTWAAAETGERNRSQT
ncbi:MAG: hypothetical protein KKB50_05050 [Planctomycetes bacterium]|nr:hypothetical protein [Planctomycetota bacterium]